MPPLGSRKWNRPLSRLGAAGAWAVLGGLLAILAFAEAKAHAQTTLKENREEFAESLQPKTYLLSIGISEFPDPVWHDLRFSSQDARDIHSYFYEGGRADGGQLLGKNGTVSRKEVFAALERLEANNRNSEDVVIAYISTHGTVAYARDGELKRFIITSDTSSEDVAGTAIAYDDLVDAFKSLRSRKKVLILAFCHSGVGKSALTPAMKKALAKLKSPYFKKPMHKRSEGVMILTASGWREPALEDSKLENDVYTHFLLEGFEKDTNGDGAVTITEAHAHAAGETYRYTNGRQRPSAIVELLGSDPIIVSGKRDDGSGEAMVYSLMRRFSNLKVSVDGESKGLLTKGVAVPQGRVRVTLKDPESGKVVADRVVQFRPGREYSVANLLIPRFPNSFTFGPIWSQFQDRTMRRSYAPTGGRGLRLSYMHDDLWRIFDGGFSVALYPEVTESIVADSSTSFSQDRRMVTAAAMLGAREGIDALSRGDRQVVTELRWLTGPGLLALSRQVDDPAFEQKDVSLTTPGWTALTGIEVTFPYYLLRLGIQGNVSAYRRPAADLKPAVLHAGAGLQVGMFW